MNSFLLTRGSSAVADKTQIEKSDWLKLIILTSLLWPYICSKTDSK